MGKELDEKNKKIMEKLKEKMEESVKIFEGSGAFCRLSTRSPKDAVDKIPQKIVPLIVEEIKKLKLKKKDQDFGGQLLALRKAFFRAMRVKKK